MACSSDSTRRTCSAAVSFGTLSGSVLLARAHGLHLIHPSRRPKSSRSLVAVAVLKNGDFFLSLFFC